MQWQPPQQMLDSLKLLCSLSQTQYDSVVDQAIQLVLSDNSAAQTTVADDSVQCLSCLLLKSVSFDDACDTLKHVLIDKVQLDRQRTQYLLQQWRPHLPQIRSRLSENGEMRRYRQLVDVKWRVSHDSGRADDVYISLQTKCSDNVDFVCSREQLQYLVSSLRDTVSSLTQLSTGDT